MKVIIPAAGAGKRLFPHTYTKPKPMVYIAGKPIIGHILDKMRDIEPEEVILVVGYKKELLISYVEKYYSGSMNITFVEQAEQLGLGHSIYVARDAVRNSEIMIALGDMIFRAGYVDFLKKHIANGKCAGSIGVTQVSDPSKYGIVELDEKSCVRGLEEKPSRPKSDLGIAGVYFIRDSKTLFEVLDEMIRNDVRYRSEFQLTNALQEMVHRGRRLRTFMVSEWYDCGQAESLLETNRVMLEETGGFNNGARVTESVVIPPVAFGENVSISSSVIGPHASIASDTEIDNSIISNSIIGSGSHLSKVNLHSSIIGDDVKVRGKYNSLNIGDSSSVEF
ncbi:MAG TPA: nucleotidyltransferase family protein [Candidatus Methanoperedenaceae archaeon]|nr:nucleotidyltransferase family protein [Candidatus Methanoperedenaceae archaeon]